MIVLLEAKSCLVPSSHISLPCASLVTVKVTVSSTLGSALSSLALASISTDLYSFSHVDRDGVFLHVFRAVAAVFDDPVKRQGRQTHSWRTCSPVWAMTT